MQSRMSYQTALQLSQMPRSLSTTANLTKQEDKVGDVDRGNKALEAASLREQSEIKKRSYGDGNKRLRERFSHNRMNLLNLALSGFEMLALGTTLWWPLNA